MRFRHCVVQVVHWIAFATHYIQSNAYNKGYETLTQQYNAPVAGLHVIYHAKVGPYYH